MKKGLMGLLASASLSVFGGSMGLPSQDPVVKMLLEKFQASVQPTIEQLQFGKSWDCKEFVATKDDFNVLDVKDVMKLDSYDGIIINSGKARSGNMVFDGNALVGLRTTDRGMFFIRASPEGDLLVENTFKGKACAFKSLSDPSLYVFSYVVCPKNKIH